MNNLNLRIVNTCNNNCIYCLEQSLRKKEEYINKDKIYNYLKDNSSFFNSICFYGGNPLLHPYLIDIFDYSKRLGINNFSIISNTKGLNKKLLKKLVNKGLNLFGFYFNSFEKKTHDKIVNGGISLKELYNNILLLVRYNINLRAIIHINKKNITNLYKDIYILNKKFGIKNFEFIGYFPFERPFNKFKKDIFFDFNEYDIYISKLFSIIEKLNINVRFIKFSEDFFKYKKYYSYKDSVKDQIGEEDIKRLKSLNPYCKLEKRCKYCFIKDYCKKNKIIYTKFNY